MAGPVFPSLERFRDAVAALNRISSDRFPIILARIIGSLHLSGTFAFKPADEAQLQSVLELDGQSLRLVLETSAFIFERAALFSLKGPQLMRELTDTGLLEAHCATFGTVWAGESAPYLAHLRSRTLGAPLRLEDSAWRLSLGMGSNADTGVKDATAVFDFSLAADRATGTAASATAKSISVEFTRDELLDFFTKLDRIQQQIDSLSA